MEPTIDLNPENDPRTQALAALDNLRSLISEFTDQRLENGLSKSVSDTDLAHFESVTLKGQATNPGLPQLKAALSQFSNDELLDDVEDFNALAIAASNIATVLSENKANDDQIEQTNLMNEASLEATGNGTPDSIDATGVDDGAGHSQDIELSMADIFHSVAFDVEQPSFDTQSESSNLNYPDVKSHLLDDYEILGPLSSGGQGAVYLIFDHALDKKKVLKVLKPELLEGNAYMAAQAIRRFILEGQIGAEYDGLPFPSVKAFVSVKGVKEIGYGSIDGVGLIQSYVAGEGFEKVLEDHCARKRLHLKNNDSLSMDLQDEEDVLIDALMDAMSPCHYLHLRGHVHRDIKPDNIKFDSSLLIDLEGTTSAKNRFGQATLLDLGLVKALDAIDENNRAKDPVAFADSLPTGVLNERDLEKTMGPVGTLPYMSTEQAAVAEDIDGRTDIYAFGCILYRILTTEKAQFKGDKIDIRKGLRALRDGTYEVKTPREIYDHIPRPLEAICLKMIHQDRKQRYQSIPEVIADLRAFRARREESVIAYLEKKPQNLTELAAKFAYRCERFYHRNKAAVRTTFALGLAGLAAAGAYTLNRMNLASRFADSQESIERRLEAGDLEFAESGLNDLSKAAKENNFRAIASSAQEQERALESILFINATFDQAGLSIINPLRSAAVRPKIIANTEKMLAWVVMSYDEKEHWLREHPNVNPNSLDLSDFEAPENWYQDFASRLDQLLDKAGVNAGQADLIEDKVGTLLFAIAMDQSTPRLYIPRSEEEVKEALALYDEVEKLWAPESDRTLALARKNAWTVSQAPDKDEKVAALNTALNDRLARDRIEEITSRDLLIEALLELSTDLKVPNYQRAHGLLTSARTLSKLEKSGSDLRNEYVWRIAMAETLLSFSDGEYSSEIFSHLGAAQSLGNDSTPYRLLFELESQSDYFTVFHDSEARETAVEEGLRLDAASADITFHVALARILSQEDKHVEALKVLDNAEVIDNQAMKLTNRTRRNISLYISRASALNDMSIEMGTADTEAALNTLKDVISEYGDPETLIAPVLYYRMAGMYAALATRERSNDEAYHRFATESLYYLRLSADSYSRLDTNKVVNITANPAFGVFKDDSLYSDRYFDLEKRFIDTAKE